MPDGDSERDRLLAEIGIDPLEAPPPARPETAPAALPASPLTPAPPPPPPPAAPIRLPRRLLGGVMAFSGAAWLGVGAANASPSALAIAGLLLLPGLAAWLGREPA
jgi:hypothetical protein